MALLVCTADGNFTDASTWALASDGTGAQLTSGSNQGNTGTSYTYCTAFTGTSGHIVDGVAIFIKRNNTTGTVSVALSDDNGVTATREVTVDAADLPAAESWMFFKFASTLTLDGGTDYRVGVKASSASNALYMGSGTSSNILHILRRTTTQAPAAGDTMLICGEWIAAGTVTARTVTMNSTAATDYGTGTATATAPTQTNTQAFTGLQIGQSGTLTWGTTAATNYILQLSGNLVVWSGGTYNQGTTGTPCPRDSTMTLQFDCAAADGDHGFLAMQGSTVVIQGQSRTSGKDVWWASLSGGGYFSGLAGITATASSGGNPILTSVSSAAFGTFAVGDAIGRHALSSIIPTGTTISGYRDDSGNNFGDVTGITANRQIRMSANAIGSGTMTDVYTNAFGGSTRLTIDTDTGWLSGDRIAIASTTRTRTECETRDLSGNATATQLTVSSGLTNVHDGMSPVQAEVILLTRNVKIRSVSSTFMTYCFFGTTATADIDWCEFRYLAVSAANKRGLHITTTTGSFDMRYCSVSDTEAPAIYPNGSTSNNFTIRYNVLYNVGTASSIGIDMAVATTGTSWAISDNIVMLTGSTGVSLADVGGTFQNNRIIGAGSSGLSLSEANTIGTISGNVIHSCSSFGLILTAAASGAISTLTSWRNSNYGFDASSAVRTNLTIAGATLFGNTTGNMFLSGDVTVVNATLNGDTSFSTATGVVLYQGLFTFINAEMSTASGVKTAHTQDVGFLGSPTACVAVFHNSKFGAATEVASQSNLSDNSYIASMNHDQVAGAHRTYKRTGTITLDTTIFNTAAPSERLTPNNATAKLNSGSRLVAVDSGATKTISVYIRKSVAGDGAAYNGAQPRLVLRRQDILGVTSDTVLATASGAAGAWEQLSGVTPAAAQTGAFEVVVDADGTAGFVNIDDWAVS